VNASSSDRTVPTPKTATVNVRTRRMTPKKTNDAFSVFVLIALCVVDIKPVACGLYYKPMMIVNDDSRVVNKLEASLTDDARVIIYDRHVFIVPAIGCSFKTLHFIRKNKLVFVSEKPFQRSLMEQSNLLGRFISYEENGVL
jgi:hypothetical protein